MNISLQTSTISVSPNDDEHIKRQSKSTRFNRLFSFDKNTLSSVENHRDEIKQSRSNLCEVLRENNNIRQKKTSIEYCHQCSQVFASAHGLNYHINMNHPNQSILCSDCNSTFRSHRALKTHQQRYHSSNTSTLPNYNYISSYLVVAFSSNQFPLMCEVACEKGHLPLGQLTSKFFLCTTCNQSFPCSRTLKYHLLKKHERYEYKLCKNILDEIILQIENNLSTVADDNDEIQSMKLILAQQASQLRLVHKQSAQEMYRLKQEDNHQINPRCLHQGRTCANLCLNYLSSYDQYIRHYSYQILTVPKGNPFSQGSIISKLPNRSSTNDLITSKEISSPSPKHKSMKRMNSSLSDVSLSSQSKKKSPSNITIAQQLVEPTIKTKETQQCSSLITSTSARKLLSKSNHTHTRSVSSANVTLKPVISPQSQRSAKRSRSPDIPLAVERSSQKRRQRGKKQVSTFSATITIDNDDNIEQPKQRQTSSGSIEYVQVLNNDQQATFSLNNIENLKSKSNVDDEEIIICRSPPSARKWIPSSPKTSQSKTSTQNQCLIKANQHQTADNDEHVRVRCKVCGDILEGRSRFSKHVLTMHSHLLNKNMANTHQQQTAIVR